MAAWQETEIKDFVGIQNAKESPDVSACTDMLNLDLRGKTGTLVQRRGHALKYSAPSIAGNITNHQFLRSDSFYITEIDGDPTKGREVTVIIEKGTLGTDNAELFPFEKVPSSLNMPIIRMRPYYDGSDWIDSWLWLNETVISSVVSDTTASRELVIYGPCNTDFSGWTLVIGEDEGRATIVSASPLSSSPTNRTTIILDRADLSFAANKKVYLMRDHIPAAALKSLYNAGKKAISFHKVLNDIKIGFGGLKGMEALSIGFRRRVFAVSAIAGLTLSESALTAYKTAKGFHCNPFLELPGTTGITATFQSVADGNYPVGDYKALFVLTFDSFQKYIASEPIDFTVTQGIYSGSKKIAYKIELDYSRMPKRATGLAMFIANTTDNVYYLAKEYNLLDTANPLPVSLSGALTADITVDMSEHVKGCCASIFTLNGENYESYYVDGWESSSVISKGSDVNKCLNGSSYIEIATAGQGGGLEIRRNLDAEEFEYEPMHNYKPKATYRIRAAFRSNAEPISGHPQVDYYFAGIKTDGGTTQLSDIEHLQLNTTAEKVNTWHRNGATGIQMELYDFVLSDYTGFCILFAINGMTDAGAYLLIDELSFRQDVPNAISEIGVEELSDSLGYTPVTQYVRGWDQAMVFNGRTHFLNPYIDQRYENKIIMSVIDSGGAFMYDVGTADNYLDFERFSGDNALGMALLSNSNILVLKPESNPVVNADSGLVTDAGRNNGCVARETIVNIEDNVIWCGENGIYAGNGLQETDISEGTIKLDYKADAYDKSALMAVREAGNDNAYRFLTVNSSGVHKEYTLTKRGWTASRRNVKPECYSLSYDGNVQFMSSDGNIYQDSAALEADTAVLWHSVPMDIDKLGGELSHNTAFIVRSLWLYYKSSATLKMRLYADDDANNYVAEIDLPAQTGTSGRFSRRLPLTLGMFRRISVEISGTIGAAGYLEIHSLGFLWKPVRLGRRGDK